MHQLVPQSQTLLPPSLWRWWGMAGSWNEMIFKVPIQPKPFYDSTILTTSSSTQSAWEIPSREHHWKGLWQRNLLIWYKALQFLWSSSEQSTSSAVPEAESLLCISLRHLSQASHPNDKKLELKCEEQRLINNEDNEITRIYIHQTCILIISWKLATPIMLQKPLIMLPLMNIGGYFTETYVKIPFVWVFPLQ